MPASGAVLQDSSKYHASCNLERVDREISFAYGFVQCKGIAREIGYWGSILTQRKPTCNVNFQFFTLKQNS